MRIQILGGAFASISSWLSSHDVPNDQYPLAKKPSQSFDWDEITPHKHFQWHACFGDFQCARLQVPMDWQGQSAEHNHTVDIAVIKLEAIVPVNDSRHGGSVIFNPGGPGGSGVELIRDGGHDLRTVVSAGPEADVSTERYYDIVGFDPRGIGATRPLITGFPDVDAAVATKRAQRAYGWLDTSEVSFDNNWASQRTVAEGASRRGAENGIAKHSSTAPVARDIVEIVERYSEWREKEASRLMASAGVLRNSAAGALPTYHRGQELVNYWGLSYGTLLGATLAALFPERVGRLVLDGVVDAYDYMAGGWTSNLKDTDQLIERFCEYCFEGGLNNCPVYDAAGPEAILSNINQTLTHFQHNPISIPASHPGAPDIVTFNELQRLIRYAVYYPLWTFPILAQIFQELSTGIGDTLLAGKTQLGPSIHLHSSPECLSAGPYSPACAAQLATTPLDDTPSLAVTCSDAPSRTNQSKADYRAYADTIAAQSTLMGGSWAFNMLGCTAWHARPAWRYEGNFSSAPAHPVLFVGNTIDPVTPLANAFDMARLSAGAGVLHQNSEGHCSLASMSMCSARAIRAYFQTGKLPGSKGELQGFDGVGALCEPDLLPLHGYTRDSEAPVPKGEVDAELWHALVGLNRMGSG